MPGENIEKFDGSRREAYGYAIAWESAIAAGATSTASLKINDDAPFAVDFIAFEARLSAAAGQAVAGTPLPRAPYPGSTNVNEIPTLSLIRMDVQVSDRNLFNIPVRASLVTGTGDNQAWLRQPLVFPAGETVRVKLYNDSAVALKADLIFMGMKLNRR